MSDRTLLSKSVHGKVRCRYCDKELNQTPVRDSYCPYADIDRCRYLIEEREKIRLCLQKLREKKIEIMYYGTMEEDYFQRGWKRNAILMDNVESVFKEVFGKEVL